MVQQEPKNSKVSPFNESVDSASLFSSVLLIEDDTAHARLIQRALTDVVGEIIHVTTGAEALQVFESTFVELVLCDLHLPDILGIDLLRSIRSARPNLPLIVMTSSSNPDDAVTAMREGAWDYTVKQFSEDFAERVKLVIVRTAQRKIQQLREVQIRAERDAYWAAASTAKDGLAILTGSGHVVFSNDRFLEFLTLLLGEAPGDLEIDLVAAIESRDRTVAASLRQQTREQSEGAYWSSELEIPVPTPDGKKNPRYFELTMNAVPASGIKEFASDLATHNEFRRCVCWVREITLRKDQERFQRELLATTTHDLKGPLGAILTSAELLSQPSQIAETKIQDLITRIASCARNSITLIDELLSARRIQDGVLVVKPSWQNAREVVEDIILDFMPVAKGKSIDFQADPIDPELEVFADKLALNRVLGNLVSNAIKFTNRGGVVHVAAERVGDSVRLSVSDNGCGIDPKSTASLFERYSRLDQHQAIEGTGLGLYVTKNILNAHNGRIEITSEPGTGSVFAVYFPDALPEAARRSDERSTSPNDSTT